jgi:hypothetical protein
LSSHLRLCLPSSLFSSVPLTETLYAPHKSPIQATSSAHFISFDFITQIIFAEEYRSLSSSLCSLLHFPVTSSLLGPNIPHHPILEQLQATFLSLCDRPSFTPIQNKKQNYNSVYFILHIFGWKSERQISCAECQQTFSDFSLLLISSWMEFWFVIVVSKYWNCFTLSKSYYLYLYCEFFCVLLSKYEYMFSFLSICL